MVKFSQTKVLPSEPGQILPVFSVWSKLVNQTLILQSPHNTWQVVMPEKENRTIRVSHFIHVNFWKV